MCMWQFFTFSDFVSSCYLALHFFTSSPVDLDVCLILLILSVGPPAASTSEVSNCWAAYLAEPVVSQKASVASGSETLLSLRTGGGYCS